MDSTLTPSQQHTLAEAAVIYNSLAASDKIKFTESDAVIEFLRPRLAGKASELFLVLLLDNKHRLIDTVELFRGTVNSCHIYPREVARAALHHNAAAVILAHNHPSADANPSPADLAMTRLLGRLLYQLDIRLSDHIIIGGDDAYSMSQCGQINAENYTQPL